MSMFDKSAKNNIAGAWFPDNSSGKTPFGLPIVKNKDDDFPEILDDYLFMPEVLKGDK